MLFTLFFLWAGSILADRICVRSIDTTVGTRIDYIEMCKYT